VGYPPSTSDKIHYDNPRTLEEAIRRENHLYEQRTGRPFSKKYSNDKMKGKEDQRKKGFKPPPFSRITHKKINKDYQPKLEYRRWCAHFTIDDTLITQP
jgi:hypothetical protein